MKSTVRLVVTCVLLHGPGIAVADFALKSDQSVLFFGDNLVRRQGFVHYVETFVRARYPKSKTRFISPGFGQRTVGEGLRRVADVIAEVKPDFVVVVFGFHDAGRRPLDEDQLKQFTQEYEELVEVISRTGAKVVAVTPPEPASARLSKYPDVDYQAVVGRYADAVRQIGKRRDLMVVDWFRSSALARIHDDMGSKRRTVPSRLIHAVLAAQLLELWQASPIEVAIGLDWHQESLTISHGRGTVERRDTRDVMIKLDDLPLPWALPYISTSSLALEWPGNQLCRFILKVSDPPATGVELVVGRSGHSFTAEQMISGVNITGLEPIQRRSKTIGALNNYVSSKYKWQEKYWSEVRPRRPKESELHDAFETYCDALRKFERGTHQIIARLPETLDLMLLLRARPQDQPASTEEQPQ